MKKTEDELQLNFYLKKWIDILRLNNWKIKIRFASNEDKIGEYAHASVHYVVSSEKALILVKQKEDCNILEGHEYDIEHLILHELVHLLFADYPSFEENTLEEVVMETKIERIASVLLEVERGKTQNTN